MAGGGNKETLDYGGYSAAPTKRPVITRIGQQKAGDPVTNAGSPKMEDLQYQNPFDKNNIQKNINNNTYGANQY